MRAPMTKRTWLGVATVALLAMPASLFAQPRRQTTSDNSGVGVARVSMVAGDASRRHGRDVTSAESGMPLVGGDSIFTGPASRVEIRLDDSNFIRLDSSSEVLLKQLGQRAFQINVVHGSVSYSMLKYGEADVDLRTPNANFVPQKDGVYRVEVMGPKESKLIVRNGEAEVLTPQQNLHVKKGRSFVAREYEHGARQEVVSAPDKDAFDEWAQRRDKMMDENRGPRYARNPWYPGMVHVGVGYGYPYWAGGFWGDPLWGGYPYWGGFYGGPTVIVRGGGWGRGGGHRR
ncbi:FecR domain-containing protein [uncultured Paludibaculum sp.]|uniref:FecR domain-containing protein n=1 Tax=uncultured Paludibaculum sp. TaxID=1765020 RepID=UPI002AAC2984|nr:FecR domain-containing protein [uncultured Paludibaculum sp.]